MKKIIVSALFAGMLINSANSIFAVDATAAPAQPAPATTAPVTPPPANPPANPNAGGTAQPAQGVISDIKTFFSNTGTKIGNNLPDVITNNPKLVGGAVLAIVGYLMWTKCTWLQRMLGLDDAKCSKDRCNVLFTDKR